MTDNPWQRLPDRPPFVLPEDEAVVREFNSQAAEEYRLRIDELLPEPFVGDPNAPVLLLGNNPGFSPEGAARKKEPRFAARMRGNLLHERSDCPFVFFAPDIVAGHRRWWDRKLKGLLHHFGHEALAKSILAVEHFPYPSKRYGGGGVRLPSRAQDYSFGLVRRAMERKAIIVLTRGQRRWLRDLPVLEGYDGLCRLRNPQTASVSRGNCDRFQEVVRAIQAHLSSDSGAAEPASVLSRGLF
ncbi:MAG TPA: hypothetical protein VKD72_18760 [Gemmataceae bacterium]|nr:hypothetical protein [Gemmataceae bacterium]